MKKECEHVRSIEEQDQDYIHPGHSLPHLYDKAIGALETLIFNEILSRRDFPKENVVQNPGFSYKWNVTWTPEDGPTAFRINRKKKAPNDLK